MADFPASGRSSGNGMAAFGCAFLIYALIFIAVGGIALYMMIHGLFVQDLWQVVGGIVTIAVLAIVRTIVGAILKGLSSI